MITMYDSVDVGQIPSNASAVAGYVGGKFTTFPTLRTKFPKAHRLSIAVNSSETAECLDIENGDATPGLAPAWFHRMIAGQAAAKTTGPKPCFYCSLSVVNELVAILQRAGIKREEYRLWVAHYTGHAHLCGPNEGIVTHADATQYFDKALGRNLDVSLCEDSFFGAEVVSPGWIPVDEKRWERELAELAGKKSPWALLRRRVLIRTMVHRERQIVALAQKSGWQTRNRRNRYRTLFARTGKR